MYEIKLDEKSQLRTTVQPPVLVKKDWKKPQLQQLRVNLDTAASLGSNIDGFLGSVL